MYFRGFILIIIFTVNFVKGDISEILNKQNEDHHHHHHEHHEQSDSQTDPKLKELQEIKFSLNIILRELKYLMSHPVFENIKLDMDKSLIEDSRSGESVLTGVMNKVEEKLLEMQNVEMPNYATEYENTKKSDEEEVKVIQAPTLERNLAPPITSKVTTFGTVIDNFWLNDGQQSPDASSKILVAISPVLRAPALDQEFFRRNKRELEFPLIDPLEINDELMSKLVFRRAIDNSYNYNRPNVGFEEGATNVKEDKEYLPPLETSPNVIDIIRQPYSKETGYNYDKPSKPFDLPNNIPYDGQGTNEQPQIIKTTTKAPEKEYLPPLEPAPANNVPVEIKDEGYNYPIPERPLEPSPSNTAKPQTVRPTTERATTTTTTTRRTTTEKYLPPLEPAPANNIPQKIDSGYDYPRPSRPFPPREPSASNEKPIKIENGYNYPRPSASNTVKPQTARPITTTTRRTTTEKYLPPLEPAPANNIPQKIDSGYDYPKPSRPFPPREPSPSNEKPIKIENGYNYPRPSASNTVKPQTARPITTTTRRSSTEKYLPPLEPAPANNIPQTIDDGYSYEKPSRPFPPREPSASNEKPIKIENGYNYPRPSASNTVKPQTARPITTTTRQSTTEKYLPPLGPAPANNIPQTIDDGYSYEKPSRPFPPREPSASNEKPIKIENGYNYPRPSASNTVKPQTARPITTTTRRSTTEKYLPPLEPAPANNIPQTIDDGYSYEKPSRPFPPREPSASNEKPIKIENGYNYPRPSASNTVKPQTARPITTTTRRSTTEKYLPPYEPAPANNIPQKLDNGYDYPRPSKPFPPIPDSSNTQPPKVIKPTEPTTRRPTTVKEYLPPKYEPSNTDISPSFEPPKQKYDPVNGYDYSKPKIPFETGTRASKTFPLIELGGNDSIYDKLNPVNRLSEDIRSLTRT